MSIAEHIEEAEGYYAFDRIVEPFEGDVIKLTARELNLLFQMYSTNGDPYKFIEKIDKFDMWFQDKPYKLYKDDKWMRYVTNWLKKEREQ